MPKKSKKGGGAKTEEERVLLQQQRAQAEEEMAKKKEEVLTLFLKDKLQRDERSSAVNLLKVTDGWRSALRLSRDASLRDDVTVLQQTFERQLDGLDAIIQTLVRQLQDGERQASHLGRIHLQHLKRLLALHGERVASMQRRYERLLQRLCSHIHHESAGAAASAEQRRADLENARFTLDQQHDAMMEEIQQLHRDTADFLHVLNRKKLDAAAASAALEMSVVKDKTDREWAEWAGPVEPLPDAGGLSEAEATRLQGVVRLLKTKLDAATAGNQQVAHDLGAAVHQAKKKTLQLQEQLSCFQRAGRKQLTQLSAQSDRAARRLHAAIATGEKLLRVGHMCHKLQSDLEQEGACTAAAEGAEPAAAEQEAPLQQAMLQLNGAVLWREAARRRRDDLRRQNLQLRSALQQQLDAMTLSAIAADQHHDLVTVLQAPAASGRADAAGRHNVIEAAHVARYSL
ncbi:uncharacterized protein V6R79_007022 [Siganus canaliculatus]